MTPTYVSYEILIVLASPEQLKSIAVRWTAAWGGSNAADWVALYAPTATYIDHAFQIRRTGSAVLTCHWEIWRTSIPDFVMEVEHFHVPQKDAAVDGAESPTFSIRTINKGTFLNDLPSKKASGKKFVFRGVVDFKVNQEGLIENIEEWYSWDFGQGKDVAAFHTLPAKI